MADKIVCRSWCPHCEKVVDVIVRYAVRRGVQGAATAASGFFGASRGRDLFTGALKAAAFAGAAFLAAEWLLPKVKKFFCAHCDHCFGTERPPE